MGCRLTSGASAGRGGRQTQALGASRIPSKTIACSPVPRAATNSHSHWTVGIRKAPGRGCVQVATQFLGVVVDCDACQMEQRISLVTLGVSDLAWARSFYEEMGWDGAQQPDEEVCFFQAGGMVLGLWTALGGHGAPVSNSRRMFEPQQSWSVKPNDRTGGSEFRW
jgi:hypothetical protein